MDTVAPLRPCIPFNIPLRVSTCALLPLPPPHNTPIHTYTQIHVLDGGKKVHIYSRNAEDMTPRYPDIVSRLPGWLTEGTTSIVLDGEAVAWDPDKAKILPFQVLCRCLAACLYVSVSLR